MNLTKAAQMKLASKQVHKRKGVAEKETPASLEFEKRYEKLHGKKKK